MRNSKAREGRGALDLNKGGEALEDGGRKWKGPDSLGIVSEGKVLRRCIPDGS